MYGRFVHDLPNKKIADIEKNAQSAYCSPPDCLESVHKMVMKSQQIRGKEDDVEDVNETQETIIQSEKCFCLFPVTTRRCFDVVTTVCGRQQRCYNVKTTSCAYWV